MSAARTALYRAICANPDEDTPRLAFADLLDEEGDALRAAFIRAQVALARVPDFDPVHVAVRRDHPDAILGHCMVHTLPPIPPGFGWHSFEFRRGFPWKAGLRSAPAFDDAGAIFQAAPIEALDAGSLRGSDLEALARWPQLSRIRRLDFSAGRLAAVDAKWLGHSPHAVKLRELAFQFDGISPEGLEELARSPNFARLTAFEVRASAMPAELLVDALGALDQPVPLERLSLASNRLTGIDAAHLLALPVARNLKELDLSGNPRLGPAGAEALAQSGIRLRVLDLEGTHIGVPGMKALCETGALAGVSSLNLTANRFGPTAVKALALSRAIRNLRVLKLAGNPIGDAGARALAGCPALSGLAELDLAGTGITDAGAQALAGSPYLGELLLLNLAGARMEIAQDGRRALATRFGSGVIL